MANCAWFIMGHENSQYIGLSILKVVGNEMKRTLKRIFMDAQGNYIWNLNKNKGPRVVVKIDEKPLKNELETTGHYLFVLKKPSIIIL